MSDKEMDGRSYHDSWVRKREAQLEALQALPKAGHDCAVERRITSNIGLLKDELAASPPTSADYELHNLLSNHENLCENQQQACGDCRRLKAALNAWHRRGVRAELMAVFRYPDDRYSTDVYEMQEFILRRLEALDSEAEGGV